MKKEVVELENGLRQVTTYNGGYTSEVYTVDKDGIKQGLFEKYYDNGQLEKKCTYKDGKFDGPYERYHWNGELIKKCTYKDGKYDGPHEEYYKNGQLKVKCTYKDGKLDGAYEKYYEDGELIEECIYKNNEVVEDKLFRDRKGLNKLLQSLVEYMKPTEGRQQIKRQIVKEYRKIRPKNGGR